MRKTIVKEVTKTTVKIARMSVGENGLPVAEKLDDVVLVGNMSLEKAQKEVNKRFETPVTVFGVEPSTEVYELSVEAFLQYATLKVDAEPEAAEQIEAVII